MALLNGKRVLVTGGTGSLGQALTKRLLTGELGLPEYITVFSRDEAKQHYMRLSYMKRQVATDEVIYRNFQQRLRFRIGDMRDPRSVLAAVKDADVVIHTAALKQVPTCEYFPGQAVMTNIMGAQNLVDAARSPETAVEVVVGLSTDKAAKPINVMGMTKAIMERLLIEGNMWSGTRFVGVRYGNVIASRGSVVPLFLDQIAQGGPVTITSPDMTRFLLSLDRAVDTIIAALEFAHRGEIVVPTVPAARIMDLAQALIGEQAIAIDIVGIRPGEKLHEIMISEEDSLHTVRRHNYYVIQPMLPELRQGKAEQRALDGAYSSSKVTLSVADLRLMLQPYIEDHRLGMLL